MQKLLDAIFEIVQQDRKELKEMIERGDMFNIFEVLGWETDEVRTHSAFIAGLLNPHGQHSCGDKFLQAFIDVVECTELGLNAKKATVNIEVDTGAINKKKTEGGRIDILVESGDKAIIIENKIYADDQKNQLLRYHNYAAKTYKSHFLLYLTLDGHSASEISDTCDVDYWCINYRDDILPWLERCYEIAEGKPMVQTLIRQYRTLIKKLTNQMNNDNNEKKIMDLLCSSKNAEKTAVILDRYDEIRDLFTQRYYISKLDAWAEKQGMEILGLDKWWFAYRPKGWENHFIGFEHNRVRHFIQVFRDGGRQHKLLQLSCLKGKPAKNWPFGYITCSDYVNRLENVTTGKSLDETKKLISSIIEEITTLSKTTDWNISL